LAASDEDRDKAGKTVLLEHSRIGTFALAAALAVAGAATA
jgi:hypothetical protein